jgi:hypothetical protein
MANDYTPVFTGGVQPFTSTAASAITGGTLVETGTTGTVQVSGTASTKVVGVAAHDAATGARVTVWPLPGIVHEIVHTAGGTVGDTITSLSTGLLATTAAATAAGAGTMLGVALTTGAAAAKIRFIGR